MLQYEALLVLRRRILITRRAYTLTVGITFVVLALATRVAARNQFFSFDEAYNLNVSKTLATRGIYATQLLNQYIPYDPAVTTGPTVILPLGLAIRVLGAQAGVIRGALVVAFIFYLALAFWAVREMFGRLVALASLIVLSTTPLFLPLGVSAQGDVPAICLALFALALLDRADRVARLRPRLLILTLSGLSLGLGVLAKDILMLLVMATMSVTAIALLRSTARGRVLAHAIPILLALGIVFGWRGYQYLAMRVLAPSEAPTWLRVAQARAELLRTQVAYAPFSHVRPAWESAYEYFAPYLICGALGLLAISGLRYVCRLPLKWAGCESTGRKTIVAASAMWCLWYFFLSGPQAVNRHFLPGVVFLELLALQLTYQLWSSTAEKSRSAPAGIAAAEMGALENRRGALHVWARYSLASTVTLLIIWGVWHGITQNREAITRSRNALLTQLRVAEWLESNTPPSSSISGWGWYVPWHISFLANRMPSQVDLHTPSLEGMTDWLVLIPEIANSGMDKRLQDFLGRQGRLEYSEGGYEIYRIKHRREDHPSYSSPPTAAESRSGSIKKTSEQLRAILRNVKAWKAQGHSYTELNLGRAITDGLLPSEMVNGGGIANSFGGPVDISSVPRAVTMADTFLVVLSGVPNEECAKLAFPPNDNFIVYAGVFQRAPTNAEQAKSLCTTGNMWFVAR